MNSNLSKKADATSLSSYALKSDINTAMIYRGVIIGDLDRGKNKGILPGIYSIENKATIINAPSDFLGWGVLIQFPDQLCSQMILNSSTYVRIRKYAGSNPSWSEW